VTPPSENRAGAETTGLLPPPGCPAHCADSSGSATALYGPAAESDPNGVYEQLRKQHGPVAPVVIEGNVPAWLVLGYQENMEATRMPARFSRDSRRWRDFQEGRVPADSPIVPMLGWRPDCVSQDGAEHQRLRAAVEDSLARFDKHGIRRHIQRYAAQLINEFAELGTAELMDQFAQQLPMLVLTRLFGMPEEVGPRLIEASAGIFKGGEQAMVYNDFILETLRKLAEDKRANPGHDFASWLIAHPAELTEEEVQHHLRLVMVAANETTTNLIANTLRVVLTDPRFRASLTGGMMTVSDAVEQVLWDEPPMMVMPARFAAGDMEFGGHRIAAGDLLLLGLAAGNADPAVRPDPTVTVHGNRSHLAFSRGPHECPGQDIGRAITDTAVDLLLTRLPDIHLAVPEEELSWTSSTWSRHLNSLPTEFSPRRRIEPEIGQTGETAKVRDQDVLPGQVPGQVREQASVAASAGASGAGAQSGSATQNSGAQAAAPARRSGLRGLFGRLLGRK
jgi:cytochrome P450